ncbi:hypothetical protein N866_07220 [Actinotalea ferrariae CF5-4]|uniref:Uncharacterized protein n=1 Tax=Actinotalea ferrariae CF5-4 TaxID=948458 RepID=A0A021W028_9CELL|nr:hypothetical protein [Actinotalea ferrariae]EYR64682.1 hypothetical protein N866_07220 [Actinotalea ferrariae CF5-4]
MTVLPARAAPPERMSHRARAYMAIVAARHLLTGIFYLWVWGATDDAVHTIWGAMFLVVGLIAALPFRTGRDGQARLGLLLSIAATSVWFGSFLVAAATTDGYWSALAAIALGTFVAKDLTMVADPLRNPFEALIREELQGRDGG